MHKMRLDSLLLLLLIASAPHAKAVEIIEEHTPEITEKELMAHAAFLADDDLKGRAAGSDGAIMAAAYIAAEYERLELIPVGDNQTYYQSFSLPRGFKALPETSLTASKGSKKETFAFKKNIFPLPSSAPGIALGCAVFVGYGISAPDLGYDDYEEVNVKGKIVVALRGVPNSKSRKNPFSNSRAARQFSTFRSKQDTAAALGAAGLIIVNDPENHRNPSDDVLLISGSREQGKIPCLHMTYNASRKMFSGTGVSLSGLQKYIDAKLKPRSKEIEKLELRLNAALEVETLLVHNVVGLLKSEALDAKDEVLVIGAHFDHIGLGEFGSLGGSKARGQIHNGADDNASGTASVMEIAGYLKPKAGELKRNVLFICFTAEEMGLHGSKHYVENPLVPIEKTAAMINLDMVSYLSNTKKLEIYGTGTSPSFEKMLNDSNRRLHIKTKMVDGAGRGMSDHAPFYKKGLPVLFFITGLHKNYHRPSDDLKYMDKRGFEKVARLAGEVAFSIATVDRKPVFTPTSDSGMDTGPYLGISVEDRDGGIYIANVAKGSPAHKFGMKGDDQLVEVNDKEIASVSLFYGLWAGVSPGDRVDFLVRRTGRLRTLRVRLDK